MRNSKDLMFGIMAMAAMLEGGQTHYRESRRQPEYTDGDKEREKQAYKKVLLSKGVKEFSIDGFNVMARTYEKALKKVDRLKKENK